MAERHHARVVLSDTIHGSRPHPQDNPCEAVLSPQLRVPDKRITTVSHACNCGKEPVSIALPLHYLDQNSHALVKIEKTALLAVEQGIGVVDARINPDDG